MVDKAVSVQVDDWRRMMFKRNKVWLALDEHHKPMVRQGKVLIKYDLQQSYEYWVSAAAVRPIDPSRLKKRLKAAKPSGRQKQSVEIKEEDVIRIYTSGISNDTSGKAGIGVCLRYKRHERKIARLIGPVSSHFAELSAIYSGLREVKTKTLKVRVYTQSGFAYGLLVLGWAADVDQALIRRIKKLMADFTDLKIVKLKEEPGNEENTVANMLAVSAIADDQKSALPKSFSKSLNKSVIKH